MKIVGFCIFILLMSMGISANAGRYSLATLESLDDKLLARVSGQDGSIQHARDPLSIYGNRTIDALNQINQNAVSGDLSQLRSMFYVNPAGQTVLQINREVVSIGIIEFRLNMNSLSEMASMMAEQLLFE